MKIVDLSHNITDGMPMYPGDPPVVIKPVGQYETHGYLDFYVSFGTHSGTHIDAPSHMVEGGKDLKDYSVDDFVKKAICIDATKGFSVDDINIADIKPGMAVIFYTGTSNNFYKEAYWQNFPVLSIECCELLAKKGVSIVGLDTGGADNQEGFPVHKALLGAGILIIENIAPTASELVGKQFELFALPIKLEREGAPARVVARMIS